MTEKISLKEKIGYAFGDVGSNFIWTAAAAFLTFYYTDVIGLGAAAVGTLLLIARVFDGFVDIGVGALIDRTKSKHGKARPWLLWMAIPFGLAGFLLFTVPDLSLNGALIYAYVTYLIVNIIYSLINVPYGVLNSLITQDPYQRSVLNIFRMVFALSGALAVNMLTIRLVNSFGGGKPGWSMTFILFGTIAVALFFITFLTTKERVKPSVVQKEIPLKRGIKALFRNKYWILVLLLCITSLIIYGVNTAVNIYYAQYVLHDVKQVATLGMASLIPKLVCLLFIAPFIKRFGKRNVSMAGIIFIIAGSLIMAVDPSSLNLVLIGTIVKSFGLAPIIGTTFALLADTVDYGEWKTGIRTEGLVYSAGSFGSKAGSGIGAALVGWLLSAGGYVSGQQTQSEAAIASLHFLFIYLPIILSVIMFIILWFYKLDKEYPQIMKDLNEVKNT